MTLTRAQQGVIPRKVEHHGYVETPTRRRVRTSKTSAMPRESRTQQGMNLAYVSEKEAPAATVALSITEQPTVNGSPRANGSASVAADAPANADAVLEKEAEVKMQLDGWREGKDPRFDYSGRMEFGGPIGVTAMMIGFPLLMWYMWIGATYYDGRLPLPSDGQSPVDFLAHLAHLVYQGAFPSLRAWTIYWTFIVIQAAFYVLLPGIAQLGKPLTHEGGRQLEYYCSGVPSWYATIALALALHVTGLFPLYTILDEFGPLMSVAIASGFIVAAIAYASAIARGAQHRMTGSFLYDFFMGAELNPRIFGGLLDLKMFCEVRIPWFILFLLSLSAAARQYEQFGYVSAEVAFVLMAHFLYANACCKAEEMIVTTWDMYYEKWGFMLIFWNLAGVPLSYCHCTIYLANHPPSSYRWNPLAIAALFAFYLFIYWVWDTSNAQKNRFRQSQHGGTLPRRAFPQLPWQEVKNPKVIRSASGDVLLADGWFGYARKINYTCDAIFALCWGWVTGFNSPFPWFYPVFFSCMILHRAIRDIERCRIKYGAAWKEFEKSTPYLFIPYVI